MSTVREAVMALLERCDGARALDGEGFNGRDAPFAHSLGEWRGKWTIKQENAAYKMLKKYKVQLTNLGFDYDSLTKENNPVEEAKLWTVDSKFGLKIAVRFPYDPEMTLKLKDLPWESTHRAWNPSLEAWWFDANAFVVGKLSELGFEIPPEVAKIAGETVVEIEEVPERVEVILQGATSRIRGSLGKDVLDALDCKLRFQPDGIEWTNAVQSGEWDGYIRLFKKHERTFPTGLLTMVLEVLEEYKWHLGVSGMELEDRVVVIDERTEGEVIPGLEWFGWKLRPYQREVLDKALLREGGMISMPTGSGKTLLALKLIHEMERSAVILVHRKELLYQWAECVREYLREEPGLVGDGLYEEKDITIAMLQTVNNKPLAKDYDIMFVDEGHHVPAETFQRSAERIGAKYRFGLSATPRREDGRDMMIWAQTGTIVANITVEDLVEKGYLAKPKFLTLKFEGRPHGKKYADEYQNLMKMPSRNKAIVDLVVRKAGEGYKIYVDVKRIKHGRLIADMLNERGVKAVFISGGSSTELRQKTLSAFEEDGFVLVSTLIKEGVDLPAMNMVLLSGGGKSGTMVIQTIGRALRPKAGTNEALVVDLKDTGYYTKKHYRQRQNTMRSYYTDLYDPEEVEG